MPAQNKILVVRNDKLGDFMLSYPAFALLKNNLPNTEVHALVQAYTQPMAELCPSIDKIIIDPGKAAGFRGIRELAQRLKQESYDAVITLFSMTHVGVAVLLAGIPYRLAPATKIAQIFYNHRLKQRRSLSEQPEYIYNRDLAETYLNDIGIKISVYPEAPFLVFEPSEINTLKQKFCKLYNIAADKKLVFIHPGSGGSANNLSVEQFSELGRSLARREQWQLVISAGPGEVQQAEQLASLTSELSPVTYISSEGLEAFARHLAFADLFISGSTGPLHIAGALDRATAAFYPNRRSATPLRWQTLSADQHRLAFSPPPGAHESDMQSIDIKKVAEEISNKLL
ncbi:MAG: glycosyltransferase family 9 protein [Thioalkalispiraceae bacterium]|jgi:ADP-heptose:LPS heptosyltransferase